MFDHQLTPAMLHLETKTEGKYKNFEWNRKGIYLVKMLKIRYCIKQLGPMQKSSKDRILSKIGRKENSSSLG